MARALREGKKPLREMGSEVAGVGVLCYLPKQMAKLAGKATTTAASNLTAWIRWLGCIERGGKY